MTDEYAKSGGWDDESLNDGRRVRKDGKNCHHHNSPLSSIMIINTCRLKVMKIHRVEAVTMMAAPKTARMRRRLGSSPWLLSSEVELPFTALKSVTPGKKRDVVRPKILSWQYLNSWCQSLPNPSTPPAPHHFVTLLNSPRQTHNMLIQIDKAS